jgi:hypothetical protein
MRILGRGLVGVILVGMVVPAGAAEPAISAADREFFEAKVRPILVERCYSCHSAGAKVVRGNLLLDTRAGWATGGDLGPAVVPGNLEESTLVQAIGWEDDALKMPPKGKLVEAEVAVLVDWVRRGAPDPRTGPAPAREVRTIDVEAGRSHWAFGPLAAPPVPMVTRGDWARNPIDRFIQAAQEAKGLTPGAPAERRVLVRRLYFDITGLPPTPAELDAALADPTPDAYERLVDRLLASPRFGERWSRHWLDLSRFAESHGFEHDYDRPSAYHYRDFLVEAINADLPFDRFVSWQLAGDELEADRPLAMKATGFLAAGVHSTQITASQAEKERYDELDDIVNTTGTAFLGLTIGCARCHDHKYDPIAAKDYYRLVSTFTTTVRSEADLDIDPAGDRERRARFDAEHQPYLDARSRFEREELPGRLARWEAARTGDADDYPWLLLDLDSAKSQGGATLTRQDDGSYLAGGASPDHDTYVLEATVPRGGITAIRLEALADPSLAKGGPGRAGNGNFALSDFALQVAPVSGEGKPRDVPFRNARATFQQSGLPVAAAIDQDGTSAWAVDPQFGKDHAAVFETEAPAGFDAGTALTVTLRFANNLKHSLGRVRLAVSTASGTVALDAPAISQDVRRLLDTPDADRTADQEQALLAWYRTIDPEWRRLNAAEQAHAAAAPKPSVVKALISSEGVPAVRLHTQGPDFYEKTFLLRRGDLNQKVEEATPGFLPVLMARGRTEEAWQSPPPSGARTSGRRAALARWMTDADGGAGGLLARVAVNRIWQHYLGRGIVATPSDFGLQGERPSHPELLDWLAGELIRGGWSPKAIHRLILTSAAYRQASRSRPEEARIDLSNTYFWRQNRRRLEAEAIRDAMLAVAGSLDGRLYGPGTLDPDMTRRSLYFTIKRSRLVPMMTLFDAPDALVPIATRATTTVAPQSLFLLNSPQVRSWSESFAARVARDAGADDGPRIREAYRIAFGREPEAEELASASGFLASQRARHGSARDADRRALADLCQVLLSLNEFLFIE